MDYPDLDILSNDDETMLRKLVDLDKNRKYQVGSTLYSVSRNSREGTLVRHLDQAHMLNVSYPNGDPSVLEVYTAGHSYLAAKEAELEAERKRVRERKEDKLHDWKISAFTAAVGVIGVVIGFLLGRIPN